MDDILRVIKKHEIGSTLERINQLHPNLAFTKELEKTDGTIIAFLDMNIIDRKN